MTYNKCFTIRICWLSVRVKNCMRSQLLVTRATIVTVIRLQSDSEIIG